MTKELGASGNGKRCGGTMYTFTGMFLHFSRRHPYVVVLEAGHGLRVADS